MTAQSLIDVMPLCLVQTQLYIKTCLLSLGDVSWHDIHPIPERANAGIHKFGVADIRAMCTRLQVAHPK
ncbi:uncharacterized protein LACBIDRAFT_299173 [Laccaria bicolor S238N-H82]|uniref:Predicted protein n=1 Tax=Laccaria bicolor (strain S238N-H82 / ATCC MYA-4686) TaxID=486041 RepID=B0E3L7_LACBS|nr:uncharacterized protein LACBIDRAFT_299173 [Laccaria bicolor S238N-H82]EDQ98566.1 predicted protein [Laccaria bicolor S238N-H82]|eukprot:XP_001890785.1 predicted protein [Laccaria bicolor S238N-H82]